MCYDGVWDFIGKELRVGLLYGFFGVWKERKWQILHTILLLLINTSTTIPTYSTQPAPFMNPRRRRSRLTPSHLIYNRSIPLYIHPHHPTHETTLKVSYPHPHPLFSILLFPLRDLILQKSVEIRDGTYVTYLVVSFLHLMHHIHTQYNKYTYIQYIQRRRKSAGETNMI